MKIESSAFADNQIIPARYTCDGENFNPPLFFGDVPSEAKSLVLIVEDPDVPKNIRSDGMWDHWLVWNIPPETREIAENAVISWPTGKNTGGKNTYGGPCPPDRQHRYFFKLYALDVTLNLLSASGKKELLQAMDGHILAQAQLVGLYARRL
ncbi:kinase inhibitor [Candidatus Nomurabacteria bacterium RIFCSPLOWO2_02_FULL_42_17]|uniref:Kinase inhibitor n=2 Tax=Candidatus Nomuraibacteriota TaxID=1752729 RepID=A0A1F6WKD4_9BACT|nr:MAG: kinase inhibitor [Candidatus Nomurabacteria bacterium RIFCSPHIGHO2_02_FULL_42_24]OGI97575.1 MAG: kinase inhibitor [Candidatus Nomurabacteria bacterium RIFCSPLOWO2_02_FULL_42_17]